VLSDHLERHGSQEAYEAAKRRLLELVPRACPLLLPADDARVRGWDTADRTVVRFSAGGAERGADPAAKLRVADGRFLEGRRTLARVADLRLAGDFQRANALAALGLARALGATPEALAAALPRCGGHPHRLEELGTFAGHRVWDNGVSTTPDATASALVALAARGEPVTLLAGGQAKALPLEALARTAAQRARRAITFGASGAELARAFRAAGLEVLECADLEQAVERAFAHMEAGEALLFSPACASFDRHLNFQDRARAFRAALPG
jgi:UDP-N-acetylmuramoylalanine--D-glutamate ligase